jgi:hypothetical protein
LDGLVAPPRWNPEATGVQSGSLGILDTAAWGAVDPRTVFHPVTDSWLAEFARPFDFVNWADGL